jgi:DNA-binding cell septation regulator SpoVG
MRIESADEASAMRFTDIQIVPIKPRNGLLGFVSFVLNGTLYLGDIAIYSRLGQEGYRLVYPMRTLSNGAKVNIFHPITREVGHQIEKQVSAAYRELMQKA